MTNLLLKLLVKFKKIVQHLAVKLLSFVLFNFIYTQL